MFKTADRVIVHALVALGAVVSVASGEPRPDEPNINGVWKSDGYGYVLNLHDDSYTVYEVTSKTAVKAHEGAVESIGSDLGEIEFDAAAGCLRVALPYTLTPITLRRVDALPDVCRDASEDADPVTIFEIVWRTLDEQYAFFELRGVDWDREYAKWRPKVSAETTDAELFEIIASMVSTLGDNHVSIDADGFEYAPYQRVPEFPLTRVWRAEYAAQSPDAPFIAFAYAKFKEYVAASEERVAALLKATRKTGANGQLVWGVLPSDIGYLAIRSLSGFSEDEDPAAQFDALEKAIDQAVGDLAGARAVIVDVRFNTGGWDDAALILANRFADRKRPALSKQARSGGGFTPPTTVHVEPAGPRQFTRPVVLLTSPMTISAAEIFTFAMTALPHVTHAGQPTMGVHSDMLERHLPNGWTFYLSNEVYRDPSGAVHEKTGIRPTRPIAMFTPDDFADGEERVLSAAIELAEESFKE